MALKPNRPSQVTRAITGDVPNTFRQMGGSLGVAAFGEVVTASSGFEHGPRVSFAATAVLVAVSAAGTFALRTSAHQSSPGK